MGLVSILSTIFGKVDEARCFSAALQGTRCFGKFRECWIVEVEEVIKLNNSNSDTLKILDGEEANFKHLFLSKVLSSQKRPVHWVKNKTMLIIGAKRNN